MSEQIRHDELLVLLTELKKVLHQKIAGDVVEMGCYEGTSALFEARVLKEMAPKKDLWLYDSFQGLPAKTNEDMSVAGEWFQGGELRASRTQLQKSFVHAGLPLPQVTKGWFNELTPEEMPPEICFAFLDGDFYESIMDSFKLVWPQMSEGAVVIVDDYTNTALPGAAKAVNDWLAMHPAGLRIQASLAIISV